jgi:hypothetical protein
MLGQVFKKNYFQKQVLKTKKILNLNFSYNTSAKKFSGGHGHEENQENNYHPRKYDRISYNKKLTNLEREK